MKYLALFCFLFVGACGGLGASGFFGPHPFDKKYEEKEFREREVTSWTFIVATSIATLIH